MKYLIETKDFGKIEIDSKNNIAYFFLGDYETDIINGEFFDQFEREFRVYYQHPNCVVKVITEVEIGRSDKELK